MEATLELAGNAASNDPDVGLRAVAALRVLTEQLEILQVDNARALGWSWQEIAARLGVVLRDQGITPERVTWEAVRLAGAGRGASLSDVLDRDALASIGIDLDAVRGKVEAAFGPGAFTAAPARRPRRRHWVRRRVRRARQARWATAPAAGGG